MSDKRSKYWYYCRTIYFTLQRVTELDACMKMIDVRKRRRGQNRHAAGHLEERVMKTQLLGAIGERNSVRLALEEVEGVDGGLRGRRYRSWGWGKGSGSWSRSGGEGGAIRCRGMSGRGVLVRAWSWSRSSSSPSIAGHGCERVNSSRSSRSDRNGSSSSMSWWRLLLMLLLLVLHIVLVLLVLL